ncbi:PPOX class F420-dependent oxidoreductase [Pseudonocardiaceae bacterium YIM PH 21723]|nr:PPOX class F420-dependent oxidoreductase [Pseudonocardiaceae bacterium YIM PH 21723]
MGSTLPDSARALIDAKNFATLATVNADGSPHSSVLWITRDGDDLLFSTGLGTKKGANLQREPRVSISVFDLAHPYHYVEVRGTVTFTPDPEGTLADELSLKYRGHPWNRPVTAESNIVRVTPNRVFEHNDE